MEIEPPFLKVGVGVGVFFLGGMARWGVGGGAEGPAVDSNIQ